MNGNQGDSNPKNDRLAPYTGRWVACLRGRVVGQGGTPNQAMRAAQASRYKERPEVFYVPFHQALVFPEILAKVKSVLPKDITIYLVGGAVRDAFLNRPMHDLDFVVQGNALQVARHVADSIQAAYYPLDDEHGTGRVIIHQEDGNRYTLDFAELRGPEIENDLQGRDFSINAMAFNIEDDQKLLDPLGGLADLRAKRLRACSQTALTDDPVRVLRGVRMAATFELKIDPQTRQYMRQAVSLLAEVSPERKRDELFRILNGPQPATSLRALDILGVLPHLLPELVKLKGLAQPPPHFFDVWQHTLETVEQLEKVLGLLGILEYKPEEAANFTSGLAVFRLGRYREQVHNHINTCLVPNRSVRALIFLAALYHDIGKPQTRQEDEEIGIRFLKHEHVGAQIVSQRARVLRLSNTERIRLKKIVRHHMRLHHLTNSDIPPSRRAVYRFFRDTQEAGVDICLLNLADVLATYGPTLPQDTWARYLDTNRMLLEAWWEQPRQRIAPPAVINGNDLMQIFELNPGPQIGELLEKIREAQAAGEVQNREEALTRVSEWLNNEE